jgi:2-pyrone-4,6-dicarboxylate lactonase
LGISRNVIVQATCHGSDNTAMVDAVQSASGRARGVATVRPDISESELRRLNEAGVRGVRFNFLKRLVSSAPQEDLAAIARKIASLGWHVVIYFEGEDLEGLEGFFGSLATPLVVDHMGRPDVSKPVGGPEFSRFLRFVDQNDVWVKVSCPERLSISGPPALNGEQHAYMDAVPFGRRVIEEFPDRVLWGTDWPHPNLKGHMPDDGLLVDYIPQVAVTTEQQHKLLVANPMRLYWPGEDA